MKMKKRILGIVSFCCLMAATFPVWATEDAGSLQNSTLYTGTKSLLTDGTTALTGIIFAVTVFFAVKNCIAWNASSEDEKPKHKKAVISSVAIGVVGMTISGLITIILSYYGSAS